MTEKTSKEDFLQWKKLPMTIEFFESVQYILDTYSESLFSEALIRDPNGQLTQNELLGGKKALENVLQYEPIYEENNEEG